MAETERKPATPAWILVILTLLGLSTLQKGSDSDSGEINGLQRDEDVSTPPDRSTARHRLQDGA